jgi:hypothetical protein
MLRHMLSPDLVDLNMSDERDALARSLPEIIKRLGFGGAATVLWTIVLCCAIAYMDAGALKERWWWIYGTWVVLAVAWLIGWLVVWWKEIDKTDEASAGEGDVRPVVPTAQADGQRPCQKPTADPPTPSRP